MTYGPHPMLGNWMLPVEIVLSPTWWHYHEGITFDEDFFFHPAKRVEAERKMEQVLYERCGRFGLGSDHGKLLPMVGPVHLAAGFLLSEMLGCTVNFVADGPPLVHLANRDSLDLSPETAFRSPAYRRWESLCDALREKRGGLVGDANWGGILNSALDLRRQSLFFDMLDRPQEVSQYFNSIAAVIKQFTDAMLRQIGSTSISVNRTVRCMRKPVFLHSECSLVMTSVSDYERFLMPLGIDWSRTHRPFGIHYCGKDLHRYAEVFSPLAATRFSGRRFWWRRGQVAASVAKHVPQHPLQSR